MSTEADLFNPRWPSGAAQKACTPAYNHEVEPMVSFIDGLIKAKWGQSFTKLKYSGNAVPLAALHKLCLNDAT